MDWSLRMPVSTFPLSKLEYRHAASVCVSPAVRIHSHRVLSGLKGWMKWSTLSGKLLISFLFQGYISGNISIVYVLKTLWHQKERYYFKNECECFIKVFKHEKTDESTRPQAKCFYCFRVFGNPNETWCTCFLNSFSIAPQELKKMEIFANFSHVVSQSHVVIQIKKCVH